jgi:5-methylcytosine-specific restriction protein A
MTPAPQPIGRTVEEWIGATPDSVVPARVKLRVFRRYDGRCYLSGAKINVGDAWDVEHIIPLGLDQTGNRESNLAPALKEPHKEKTARDRRAMAKADRIAKKRLGLWPKSKRPLKSRGFEPSRGVR